MLFWIVAVTLPIYAAALYMSYEATARRLEAGAQRDVDELTSRLVVGVDAVIRPIEGGIRTVAYQLEEIDPPRTQYSQRILGILKAWPDVYGSTIAVEAGRAGAEARPFAPYFFRRGDSFGFSDLALDSYAYQSLPWYRRAADTAQPVWSLPYFDSGGGNTWMVTYSVPFFHRLPEDSRVLGGVVTADLDLDWVRRASANETLGPVGMAWLMSPPADEAFVAPIGATADRVARFDRSMNPETVRKIGEGMLARDATFELLPSGVTAEPAYLAVRQLQTLGWRVMLVIPQTELLAEANELLHRQLWLGAIGLILLIVAISGVAAGIARPIRLLAAAVGKARADDLDLQLPDVARGDEIGVLTGELRRMRDSLSQHIRLRAESLAEQARLEHELQIAASIQQSMLPRPGATADLPPAVQVAAALLPARQVGGDLYDYFDLHNGRILFAIGDVSDKGIPAALFMARLSALLRVEGVAGLSPDHLLARINERLIEGNDACMFVTVGCGLLDVDTGHIRYVSAGHEPPFLLHAEGMVKSLHVENGPAIGIEVAVDYPILEGFMAPGDTLVLFTDGVTEAEAQDGSMFGIERFSELLRSTADASPAAVVERVVEALAAHASGFHATDDLTVLAVRWSPPAVTARRGDLTMHWRLEPEVSDQGIRQAQQWLHAILAAREVSSAQIVQVELIAEELLANIVREAVVQTRATQLAVDCALLPAQIVLTVRDDGSEFDPLARASPRLDVDIADRDIGGLGILMVKELAGSCSYSRVEGWNVLEVCLDRKPESN
jgi:sigma-B regulation protein RsbU (phosphoserine phosphatase)